MFLERSSQMSEMSLALIDRVAADPIVIDVTNASGRLGATKPKKLLVHGGHDDLGNDLGRVGPDGNPQRLS
jgi:hypothetical protein